MEKADESLTMGPPYKIQDVDILKTSNSAIISPAFPIVLNSTPAQMIGWTWGNGFCGEESFKQAGLYYGQYVSQYLVSKNELLIGVNDVKAAKDLHLVYKTYKLPNPAAIMKFFKDNLAAYNFVIGTVYIYQSKGGDPDYDHIVPVVGYLPDTDSLVYQDLFLLDDRILSGKNCIVSRKQASKRGAKRPDGALTYGFSDQGYEGVVSGIVDSNKETKRMILKTDCPIEPDPHLGQKPVMQNFSCLILGLVVGKKYSILRFDKNVPNSMFLSSKKWVKQFPFTAEYENCEMKNFDTGLTSASIFYRTVEIPVGGEISGKIVMP